MYFFSFKFLPLILLFQRLCFFFFCFFFWIFFCLFCFHLIFFFYFNFNCCKTTTKKRKKKKMHFRACMLVRSLSYRSRKRRLAIRKAVRNRCRAINQEHADTVTAPGLALGAQEAGGREGEESPPAAFLLCGRKRPLAVAGT